MCNVFPFIVCFFIDHKIHSVFTFSREGVFFPSDLFPNEITKFYNTQLYEVQCHSNAEQLKQFRLQRREYIISYYRCPDNFVSMITTNMTLLFKNRKPIVNQDRDFNVRINFYVVLLMCLFSQRSGKEINSHLNN